MHPATSGQRGTRRGVQRLNVTVRLRQATSVEVRETPVSQYVEFVVLHRDPPTLVIPIDTSRATTRTRTSVVQIAGVTVLTEHSPHWCSGSLHYVLTLCGPAWGTSVTLDCTAHAIVLPAMDEPVGHAALVCPAEIEAGAMGRHDAYNAQSQTTAEAIRRRANCAGAVRHALHIRARRRGRGGLTHRPGTTGNVLDAGDPEMSVPAYVMRPL